MKRRLFSILMILTLCMALLPLPAAAADPALDLTASPLTLPAGCAWDSTTETLTLTDVTLGEITLPDSTATLTICIAGSVTAASISGTNLNALTIRGQGAGPQTLNVTTISGMNITGDLKFVKINAEVGNISWHSMAPTSPNKVVLQEGSTLTVTGNGGAGLYAGGFQLSDSSKIVLNGGPISSQFSNGIEELIDQYLPDRSGYSSQQNGGVDYWLYKNGVIATSVTFNRYVTVTFNADGGTPVPADQRLLSGSSAARPAADPAKTGHTFGGWYQTDAAGTMAASAYDFTAAVDHDLALKARWTASAAPAPAPSGGTEEDNSPIVYYITVKTAENGAVTTSVRSAYAGETVTLTASPDADCALDRLTVTDQRGSTQELTQTGADTFTFTMPSSSVTVSAVFQSEKPAAPTSIFDDVPSGKYYEEPVKWAVENGITSGRDADHFDPDSVCTRGQLVTFLWRAVGCPTEDGTDLRFSDVRDGAYYAAAVRWAAKHGLVQGYSDGTFRPDNTVTRQQAAAILYRYAVYRGMDVSVGEDTNILSYLDALDVAEYAIPAMQWAVGAEILQGSAGNLLPRSGCTRAQIVTFLYRLLNP